MELHIDDIQIKENNGNGLYIDGCLYISADHVCFPSYRWFDLISVNLENWIPLIISFTNGHTDSITLGFMDGPYLIKIMRSQGNTVNVSCLEDHREIIALQNVDFSGFIISVIKCINKLSAAIYTRNLTISYESEISRLGVVSKKLRNLIGK